MMRSALNVLEVPVADARRVLWRAVTAFGLAAVFCTAAMVLDDRVLDNGHSVWLKPLRFCVAFGVHLWTLWWLAALTQRQQAGDRWFGFGALVQAGTAALELVCIAIQAARGVHSHFNYASPFDHAVFFLMGLGTAVLLAGVLVVIAGLVRWPADWVSTRATIAGLSIGVLGGLVGVWMVMPTPEQRLLLETGQRLAWVGSAWAGTPTAATLPFFGWDLRTGDWRISHFIGLHAMQALPVLAWLHRRGGRSATAMPAAVPVGAAAYLAAFLGSLVWTATGRSVLDASAGSMVVVGLPLVLFGLAAAHLARRQLA
jgi:hypothetical protein